MELFKKKKGCAVRLLGVTRTPIELVGDCAGELSPRGSMLAKAGELPNPESSAQRRRVHSPAPGVVCTKEMLSEGRGFTIVHLARWDGGYGGGSEDFSVATSFHVGHTDSTYFQVPSSTLQLNSLNRLRMSLLT